MKFKTQKYEGAWIPFDGDRRRFRLEVEKALREALSDQAGHLVVDEKGPHWNGSVQLAGLSYTNTEGWGLVVFSESHALGVDLEKETRVLKKNYLELAKRFFHPSEAATLASVSVFDGQKLFLEFWMKKEAYSKLNRRHLLEYIRQPLPETAVFMVPMKLRVGYRAVIAVR